MSHDIWTVICDKQKFQNEDASCNEFSNEVLRSTHIRQGDVICPLIFSVIKIVDDCYIISRIRQLHKFLIVERCTIGNISGEENY